MIALALRNGIKSHSSTLILNLRRRHSITECIGGPFLRTQHRRSQQSKSFAQTQQTIYGKTKALDFSVRPTVISHSTAAAVGSKVGFVGWYLGMIKSRPVVTKSITSALIYMAADLSSQTIAKTCSETYDCLRTMRMAGYGMLVIGPSLHFWFNFLSRVFPRRDLFSTVKKIAMGQAVYGPIVTALFFSANAALQGESVGEIIGRLKRDLLPTMISGVMYWPFCDFLTFKFIPVHMQPLVSNSFSYLWNVYLTYMASLEKVATESDRLT